MADVNENEAAPAPYRVTRVEIKEGDAIDQIKFVYTDQSVWVMGHEGGGKVNNRPAVMTKGGKSRKIHRSHFKTFLHTRRVPGEGDP